MAGEIFLPLQRFTSMMAFALALLCGGEGGKQNELIF
jgi:hypothetical protein